MLNNKSKTNTQIPKKIMDNKTVDGIPLKKLKNYSALDISVSALFASRDTIQEALDYADDIASHSESYPHCIAPVYVLLNTIINNYHLVPKTINND